MSNVKLRPLVLPAALAVSTLVWASACDDDTTETTTTSALPICVDVAFASECVRCQDESGNVACAGQESDPNVACFYDEDTDACDEAIA